MGASDSTGASEPGSFGRARVEALFLLPYAAAVLAYLFLFPEGELLHWLTLVLLPLLVVAWLGEYEGPRNLMRSLGLGPRVRGPGWIFAIALIFVFQGVQLLNSAQRAALCALFDSPRGFLLLVLAAVLLLGTAATTEEVFFRGLLQARLARAAHSELAAIVVSTVVFALYHVPYAYARAGSPNLGDFSGALQAGLSDGLLGGIPLGLLFWRSRHNLVPVIFVHAAIDLIPATRWLAGILDAV